MKPKHAEVNSTKSRNLLPNVRKPSCLQVTVASRLVQLRSQILPQMRLTHTWTVPFLSVDPNRRTLPSVQLSGTNGAKRCKSNYIVLNSYILIEVNQPKHLTPASSSWPQLCDVIVAISMWEQLSKAGSLPVQPSRSKNKGPVPCPKWACGNDCDPACIIKKYYLYFSTISYKTHQLKRIPAAYIPPEHHDCPTLCHRWCPTLCWCRFPLSLPLHLCHPSIEDFRSYNSLKLDKIIIA